MRVTSARFILFFLLFTSLRAFPQTHFERATIVTTKGDSIQTFIDNQDWLSSPKSILVKDSSNGEQKQIEISSLESFHLNSGDLYVAREVTLHYYPVSIQEHEELKDTLTSRETLLMRVLVKGICSLYLYVDSNNLYHFFIQKTLNPTVELVLKKHIIYEQSGREAIETISKYKQLLSYFMNDCPSIVKDIETTNFTLSSLQELFTNYNHCVSPAQTQFIGRNYHVTLKPGLVAGLTLTHLKFRSSTTFPIENATFSNSLNPTFGITLAIIFPRNFKRISFCNDLIMKHYKVTSKEDTYYGPNISNYAATDRYCFNFTYISLASTFQIDLSNKTLRPYIKAGMGNSFAIKSDNYSIGKSAFNEVMSTRTYEQGLVLGTGLKNKNHLVEIRFERGNGMSNYINLNSTTSTFYFLLGVML